jgi:hypothetical protein
MKRFRKHWWEILLIGFLILGFALGIGGFVGADETKYKLNNSLYETFRLFERKYHSKDIPPNLVAAQWILWFAFLWLSLKIIITIIAPNFLSNLWIRLSYHKHIVICGLNQITLNLVNEYKNEKIIVLAEDTNKYAESLKQKEIKLFFCGDLSEEASFRKAKIKTAGQLYIVTGSDKKNVEITQLVFSLLKNGTGNDALKCYTLIDDRELKILLEESTLFKEKAGTFDASLFNVNEMGIKYGLSMKIDKFLPEHIEIPPEIFIAGLTEKAEAVILNLAHCLTMNRKTFRFTLVEEDEKTIRLFREKYAYLWDFADIVFFDSIKQALAEKRFTALFICTENQVQAVKEALSIRYALGENEPEIIVFCDDNDTLNTILNLEAKKITVVNLFEQIACYAFHLNKEIEDQAKAAHLFWDTLYRQNIEWDKLSEHFKQTNRNQILDNYLRTFIAIGKKFDAIGQDSPIAFSDKDKETLAMMEHRRWIIEKYVNGWTSGKRNNEFKRHNCLIPWEELPESEQKKDYIAIDLMVRLLNNQAK